MTEKVFELSYSTYDYHDCNARTPYWYAGEDDRWLIRATREEIEAWVEEANKRVRVKALAYHREAIADIDSWIANHEAAIKVHEQMSDEQKAISKDPTAYHRAIETNRRRRLEETRAIEEIESGKADVHAKWSFDDHEPYIITLDRMVDREYHG